MTEKSGSLLFLWKNCGYLQGFTYIYFAGWTMILFWDWCFPPILDIETNRELGWTDFKGEVYDGFKIEESFFFLSRWRPLYLSTFEFPLKKAWVGGGVQLVWYKLLKTKFNYTAIQRAASCHLWKKWQFLYLLINWKEVTRVYCWRQDGEYEIVHVSVFAECNEQYVSYSTIWSS